MNAEPKLPGYQEQSPEVAARFERLRQRPVALDVRGLTKRFETPRGVITALNWLRPAPHPVKVFATLNAAETWLSSHLPERLRGRGPGPAAL